MPVQTRSKRAPFVPREDMGPTLERRQHQEFRTTNGVTRVVSGVETLRAADEIDDAAQDAAYRWLCEYVWARYGVMDFRSPRETDGLRHDAISWRLTRAEAGARIQALAERLGKAAQERLEMLLVEEMSFTRIGAVIWPSLDPARRSNRAQAQCALVLERLAEAFRSLSREAKAAKSAAEENTLVLMS